MTCLETKEQEVKKINNMLLGNAIELVTTKTGIKKVVDTISEKTGKDCRCAARKAKLNNPNLLINKVLK